MKAIRWTVTGIGVGLLVSMASAWIFPIALELPAMLFPGVGDQSDPALNGTEIVLGSTCWIVLFGLFGVLGDWEEYRTRRERFLRKEGAK